MKYVKFYYGLLKIPSTLIRGLENSQNVCFLLDIIIT